ncbi:MAG: YchF/TatD family DNA exonuclease [Deltaproteobacteria bacterium]|nr:YchF/TatD family DNA exonuclease [Deltaproteobacteria bacterium]
MNEKTNTNHDNQPSNVRLFDSHAHLDDERFEEDRSDVLQRAAEAGVARIGVMTTEPDRLDDAVALAHHWPGLYAAVGVHPHEASRVDDSVLERVWTIVTETARVQAVGEIGLDYHYMHSPADVQQRRFADFLHLAIEAHRPVVVHVREAHEDAIRILKEVDIGRVGGVIHCFGGGPDEAAVYLKMGLHIGFAGVVTFKKAELARAAAAATPLDRLLVETDSPYLAPVPHRGKRCEPAFVVDTNQKLAGIHGITAAEMAQRTWDNATLFYGIEPWNQSVGDLITLHDDRLWIRITNRRNVEAKATQQGRMIQPDLQREPVLSDLLEALADTADGQPRQAVLYGGEPTLRMKLIEELVPHLKAAGIESITLYTDGLLQLVEPDQDETTRLARLVDRIVVDLADPDPDQYVRLRRSPHGKTAHRAAIAFVRAVRRLVPDTTVAMTDHPAIDRGAAKKLATRLGVAMTIGRTPWS